MELPKTGQVVVTSSRLKTMTIRPLQGVPATDRGSKMDDDSSRRFARQLLMSKNDRKYTALKHVASNLFHEKLMEDVIRCLYSET